MASINRHHKINGCEKLINFNSSKFEGCESGNKFADSDSANLVEEKLTFLLRLSNRPLSRPSRSTVWSFLSNPYIYQRHIYMYGKQRTWTKKVYDQAATILMMATAIINMVASFGETSSTSFLRKAARQEHVLAQFGCVAETRL